MENLVNLLLGSKNDRKVQKMTKAKIFQKTRYVWYSRPKS